MIRVSLYIYLISILTYRDDREFTSKVFQNCLSYRHFFSLEIVNNCQLSVLKKCSFWREFQYSKSY